MQPNRGRCRGLVAPSTRIFFSSKSDQQVPSNNGLKGTKSHRTGDLVKGSSPPLRPYFFRPDRTNTSRVIAVYREQRANRTKVIGKSSSRPLRPYFFGPDRTNRSRSNWAGVTGQGSSRNLCPYFFRPDRTNRSRHLEQPDRGHWTGLVAPSTHMFFSSRSDQYEPSYNEQPDRGHWTELVAPSTPIFFSSRLDQLEPNYNGLKGTKLPDRGRSKGFVAPATPIFFSSRSDDQEPSNNGNKLKNNFSLTIFFSETITPRSTGPGSLDSVRRALYVHFFVVQIRPIGAETYSNRTGDIGMGSSRPLRTYFFRPARTNPPSVTGPGLLEWGRRALYAHTFFVQIRPAVAELYRFKENNGKENYSLSIFFNETVAPRSTGPVSLQRDRRALCAHILFHLEQTGPRSLERARRALYAHILFIQIRPIGAEEQRRKNFSLTIFFSETITPGATGPRSLESLRRALYAHTFFVQTRPAAAELYRKKNFSFAIFFSETITPGATGPRSLESVRRALYAHIFFVQIGPIGAEL
ncbi:LOW QUALITY PROTEIN: hypothetical protein V1477_006256 [Vespula maculifrons]|uniref:Ribosomal protein S3 n=1 Tax=Vespula maculifrons TaxID=7453 RepID=A0ABD2CK14_VESMC